MFERIWGSAAFLLVGLACAPAGPTVDHATDAGAITGATEAWAAAFARGDAAAAAEFVTANGTIVPPNMPAVSGTEAITAWAQAVLASMTLVGVSSTTDSVQVAGDWAVSRGHWVITVAPDSATTVADTSRFVVVWERQADGSWKAAHDIWNTALPLPSGG
jgi:ketosteroid isomerase-like protein